MENPRSSLGNSEAVQEHGAEDVENGNGQERCICQWPSAPFDHPSDVLLAGNKRKERLHLFTAVLKGDWKAAKSIMERDDRYVNSSVTEEFQTSLHVAAGAKHTDFVKKLVNWRQIRLIDLLRKQDENGNTAFCHAVMAGSILVAEILLDKDPELALIRGGQDSLPLIIAVVFGHHDMALRLFRKTKTHLCHLEGKDRKEIFFACIETDMLDIALKLLRRYGDLAVARNTENETALHLLARKPSAFDSKRSGIVKMLGNLCNYRESKDNTSLKLVESLWTNFLDCKRNNFREEIRSPNNLLFKAAELGNYKFLALLIGQCWELIWETDDQNRTIFHIAVMHRQVNVFSQIYNIGSTKDVLVTYQIPYPRDSSEASDNMLHLAAKMPPCHEFNIVSGFGLQMQRELMWFEEVKSIVLQANREQKGLEGLTPQQLFSKEHKELLEKGEKWMRDTAQSCLIVATIITTVVYSACFSIPGDYNDSTQGKGSILTKNIIFIVFEASAVALSFSVTSALIFLFMLTSRYAQRDFRKSLPMSLMYGLATLFISITAMIVSFSSAFFLAYRESDNRHKFRWAPIFVFGLALLPSVAFVILQYPLLRDIFNSTHRRSLFRPKMPLFR